MRIRLQIMGLSRTAHHHGGVRRIVSGDSSSPGKEPALCFPGSLTCRKLLEHAAMLMLLARSRTQAKLPAELPARMQWLQTRALLRQDLHQPLLSHSAVFHLQSLSCGSCWSNCAYRFAHSTTGWPSELSHIFCSNGTFRASATFSSARFLFPTAQTVGFQFLNDKGPGQFCGGRTHPENVGIAGNIRK